MSEDLGWVDLEVRPDVTGFGSRLGRGLNGPLDSIGRSSGKRFGSLLGKTAVGVAGGVMAAGYVAISIGKDAYAEAKEARKVGALTVSTIKATGGAANISAKQVGNLSESIMRKTAVDDEAIQTGANLLLTFKNVRNEVGAGNKIFNQATAASVDLSAAGFGSIDSAAKMLGKTLNDPVKGITALSRAGVTFTEGQKTKIAALVEENDLLGAQKIILGEVQSQVGGAAAAQKDAGDILSTSFGNIKEAIGTALLPEIDRFAGYIEKRAVPAGEKLAGWLTDEGVPAVRDFAGWLRDDAAPAIKDFAGEVKPLAKELLPAVGDVLGTTRDVLKEALPLAKEFVSAFNDMPDWAKEVLVGGAVAGGLASKFNLLPKNRGGAVGGLLGSSKPVPVIVMNKGFGAGDLPGGGGKPGVPPVVTPGAPPKGSAIRAVGREALKLAIPFTIGWEIQKNFPKSAPFGDEGWMPGTGSDSGGWLDLFKGGEDAVHDFGAAMEDTIPLAELLGGKVKHTGQSVSFLSDRFKALPDRAETEIKTPGLIQSRADVMDLKRKYDLTPREVKTVLRSLGFDEARQKAEAAKRAMDLLRDKTITITTRYEQLGNSGAGPTRADDGNSNVPGQVPRIAPRTTVVINLPDGRQLDGYMDDRIHANGRLNR